jgi:hypothetical protein
MITRWVLVSGAADWLVGPCEFLCPLCVAKLGSCVGCALQRVVRACYVGPRLGTFHSAVSSLHEARWPGLTTQDEMMTFTQPQQLPPMFACSTPIGCHHSAPEQARRLAASQLGSVALCCSNER